MPSSYMESNQTNDHVAYGLDSSQAVILNVLVNKNITVVQYNTASDINPYATESLITVRTRFSLNFGQTWSEIDLQTGGLNWSTFNIAEFNKFGDDNAIAEFMVRNSSGTKFLLYTPLYKTTSLVAEYATITPRREVRIVGWLVHDQKGNLVNVNNFDIMPEHQPPVDETFYQWMDIEFSKSSSRITNYKNVDPKMGAPFFGYPLPMTADAHYSGTYNAQRVINRTDTVDYVSGGKRYTIVKRYYNIYVRRGDIFEECFIPGQDPTLTFDDICVGYFVLTVPFIYVFDHNDFGSPKPKLSWVDVLGLNTHLAKLKDYLRPTRYISAFVKSLISEDKQFHDDVFYSRGYAKMPDNTGVSPKCDQMSLIFENTPHGELMKVYDREDGKDLLGLIFGNRRYVCTSNPLSASNWVLGEVKRHHRHPTEKRAFFYYRFTPPNAMSTAFLPNSQVAPSYDIYGVHYKKYETFNLTSQNLRIDIASDRVVAFPDRNYSDDGELEYRFAYFIKDPATGRYSIGIRSKGFNAGVKALTGTSRNGGEHYPLIVTRALGIGYTSESFIARESLNVYSNPLLPADNASAPDSTVDVVFDTPLLTSTSLGDVYDGSGHTSTQYCVGMQRIVRATHTSSGMTYDLKQTELSSSCGYNAGATQSSKAFKLRLQKNLNASIANSKKYYVLIDGVFTGNKQIILRPKLVDLTEWDFKIEANSITVTFLKPSEFGLTNATATHTLVIGQDNTITTANNYTESTNPSDWRAAVCEANSYESLGSDQIYQFSATINGGNATLVVENGPVLSTINKLTIGGTDYPYVQSGTVVPYSALASANAIVVS